MRWVFAFGFCLGSTALAGLLVATPAVGQPQPDVRLEGTLKITPQIGTRTRRGTIWKPAHTVSPQTVDAGSIAVKSVTAAPKDTLSTLMAKHGLRTDIHTLQVVQAVNPEHKDLDQLDPGDSVKLPDILRQATAVRLELQPELKFETVKSIKKFSDKLEFVSKDSFVKLAPSLRSRLLAARIAADDLVAKDIPLLPEERERLDAAIEDLNLTLTMLTERRASLGPRFAHPFVRRASWHGDPLLLLRTIGMSPGGPRIAAADAQRHAQGPSTADRIVSWIAGDAATEVGFWQLFSTNSSRRRFDAKVRTIALGNQTDIAGLVVCRADSGVVRRAAVALANTGRKVPFPRCERQIGDLSSPAEERDLLVGRYVIWVLRGNTHVSCMRIIKVMANQPATIGNGFRLQSDNAATAMEACPDPA